VGEGLSHRDSMRTPNKSSSRGGGSPHPGRDSEGGSAWPYTDQVSGSPRRAAFLMPGVVRDPVNVPVITESR
jgi:hypothetical protein